MNLLTVGFERGDHCAIGGGLAFAVDAADPLGEHGVDTSQPLAHRFTTREHIGDVVGPGLHELRLARAHPRFERSEFADQFLAALTEAPLLRGRTFLAFAKLGDLAAQYMHPQCGQFGNQIAMSASGIGLAFERLELPTNLAKQVLQAHKVGLGRLEAPLTLFLAPTIFEHPRRFLDDRTAIFGPGIEHCVDLSLGHDDVLLTTHTAVAQQLLDVEQTAGNAVDLILAVAGTEQASGDRDLFELDRDQPGRVVERQRHLGAPERFHLRGAGEDDVVHLLRADRARSLCAKDPGDRVDDVRLAASIRADDNGHPRLEIEPGRRRERLETFEGERLQEHSRPKLTTECAPRGKPATSSATNAARSTQTWDCSQ